MVRTVLAEMAKEDLARVLSNVVSSAVTEAVREAIGNFRPNLGGVIQQQQQPPQPAESPGAHTSTSRPASRQVSWLATLHARFLLY